MSQMLAYQIGAVFFLVVLFMAGTLTRGLFPSEIFKNVKLTLIIVGVLLAGFAGYRMLPDIHNILEFTTAGTPALTNAPTGSTAVKPATAKRAVVSRPPVVSLPKANAPEVEYILEEKSTSDAATKLSERVAAPDSTTVASDTAVVPPDSATNDAVKSGNRGKRWAHSVGRFLHIGHDKYQPPEAVKQP